MFLKFFCNRNYVDWSFAGLEVIHEETESQMSSSDSELEFENDYIPNKAFPSTLSKTRKDLVRDKPQKMKELNSGNKATEVEIGLMHTAPILTNSNSNFSESQPEEIVAKHIRISPNWDPVNKKILLHAGIFNLSLIMQEPILTRLYTLQESKSFNKPLVKESTSGFLNILSGNRKKGTFWNAWKRKFYVLSSGKLTGYEVCKNALFDK